MKNSNKFTICKTCVYKCTPWHLKNARYIDFSAIAHLNISVVKFLIRLQKIKHNDIMECENYSGRPYTFNWNFNYESNVRTYESNVRTYISWSDCTSGDNNTSTYTYYPVSGGGSFE